MPRRKPAHKPAHKPSTTTNNNNNKTRTHVLADGWTQVIRGPPPKSPGLSTPHSTAPAAGLTPAKLQAAFARTEDSTRTTPFRVETEGLFRDRIVPLFVPPPPPPFSSSSSSSTPLHHVPSSFSTPLHRVPPPSSTPPLHRVVLLAIGSPSHPSAEIRRVSMVQLAAAEAWIELLSEQGALIPAARRVVQDPAFNAMDRRFLEGRGWEVVASPEGERVVVEGVQGGVRLMGEEGKEGEREGDEGQEGERGGEKENRDDQARYGGTLLIAPHMEMPVLQGILEKWPAGDGVMVGNDLGLVEESLEWWSSSSLGKGRARDRRGWWEGWTRVRPAAAADAAGATEWFGVSLHWRRGGGGSSRGGRDEEGEGDGAVVDAA